MDAGTVTYVIGFTYVNDSVNFSCPYGTILTTDGYECRVGKTSMRNSHGEMVMANQGTHGGTSEQHKKAGQQSHKNDDKDDKKQEAGSSSSRTGGNGSSERGKTTSATSDEKRAGSQTGVGSKDGDRKRS